MPYFRPRPVVDAHQRLLCGSLLIEAPARESLEPIVGRRVYLDAAIYLGRLTARHTNGKFNLAASLMSASATRCASSTEVVARRTPPLVVDNKHCAMRVRFELSDMLHQDQDNEFHFCSVVVEYLNAAAEICGNHAGHI